jgi:hypothetical protein
MTKESAAIAQMRQEEQTAACSSLRSPPSLDIESVGLAV